MIRYLDGVKTPPSRIDPAKVEAAKRQAILRELFGVDAALTPELEHAVDSLVRLVGAGLRQPIAAGMQGSNGSAIIAVLRTLPKTPSITRLIKLSK